MRKLFDEFFYIPKHGKVREKVMLTRLASMITVVVLSLAAMSITAYAYFSCNITSGSNIIKAAHFEAKVSITMTEPKSDSVTVIKEGEVQVANLEAGNYTIELTAGESTANKGYCVITIGDKTYYTDQIGVDAAKNLTDAGVKFDLLISTATKIEVSSYWGTSVYYGYEDDDRTEIFIKNDDTVDLTTPTTSDENAKEDEKGGTEEPAEPITPPSTELTPPATESVNEQETNDSPEEQTEPTDEQKEAVEQEPADSPEEEIEPTETESETITEPQLDTNTNETTAETTEETSDGAATKE